MNWKAIAGPARVAFVLYVIVVFLLTHWPQLTIPLPGRPDLVVHLVVFGGWTVLVTACAFWSRSSWQWWEPRNLAYSAVTAACYAAFDEATQAIPFIRRQAALDDWGADMLGVALGALFMVILARLASRKIPST